MMDEATPTAAARTDTDTTTTALAATQPATVAERIEADPGTTLSVSASAAASSSATSTQLLLAAPVPPAKDEYVDIDVGAASLSSSSLHSFQPSPPPVTLPLAPPSAPVLSATDNEDDLDSFGTQEEQEQEYKDARLATEKDNAQSSTDQAQQPQQAQTSTVASSLTSASSLLPSLASLSSLSAKSFSSLSAYLPSTLSLQSLSLTGLTQTTPGAVAGTGTATPAADVNPSTPILITFKSIATFTYHTSHYYLLILGTPSSVLIYHLSSTADARTTTSTATPSTPQQHPTSNTQIHIHKVCEYIEKDMAPIAVARFLTPTINNIQSPDLLLPAPLTSHPDYLGPLLALTSADDRPAFPTSCVKIFSTFHNKFIHILRFHSPVYDVIVSANVFIVVLEQELHVYQNPPSAILQHLSFDLLYSVKCAANPIGFALCALGPRWLAYASVENKRERGEESPVLDATSTSPSLPNPLHPSNLSVLPPSAQQSHSHTHGISLLSSNSPFSSLTSSLPTSTDSFSSITRNIASSLYNLGDQSRKTISAYLTPLPEEKEVVGKGLDTTGISSNTNTAALSNTTTPSSLSSSAAAAEVMQGTVIVRDILSQRVLCHLKAHSSPIAALAFDSTGTLLVTAGKNGQYLHIYQIFEMIPTEQTATTTTLTSSSSSSSSSPAAQQQPQQPVYATRFLYRLFRGITHATLRHLSFSADSHWIACCSKKGTTHIYAINPFGGPINKESHGPPPIIHPTSSTTSTTTAARAAESTTAAAAPATTTVDEQHNGRPITLNAMHRVRANLPALASTSLTVLPIPVFSTFLRLSPSNTDIDHLAVVTSTAEVYVYQLHTAYRETSNYDTDPDDMLMHDHPHRSMGLLEKGALLLNSRVRSKETIVGETGGVGMMLESAVYSVSNVVSNVVNEAARAVKHYSQHQQQQQQQQSIPAQTGHKQYHDEDKQAPTTEQQEEENKQQDNSNKKKVKLDLILTPVLHVNLSKDLLLTQNIGNQESDTMSDTTDDDSHNDDDDDDDANDCDDTSDHDHNKPIHSVKFFKDMETQRWKQLNKQQQQQQQQQQQHKQQKQRVLNASVVPPPSSAWLANVELQTYSNDTLPLWASPNFTLMVYNDDNRDADSWWDDTTHAIPLLYDKQHAVALQRQRLKQQHRSSEGYCQVKLEEEQVEGSPPAPDSFPLDATTTTPAPGTTWKKTATASTSPTFPAMQSSASPHGANTLSPAPLVLPSAQQKTPDPLSSSRSIFHVHTSHAARTHTQSLDKQSMQPSEAEEHKAIVSLVDSAPNSYTQHFLHPTTYSPSFSSTQPTYSPTGSSTSNSDND